MKVGVVWEDLMEKDYPLLAVHHDVGNREDWENVLRIGIEHFGKIDILVNNAAQTTQTDILQCTEEEIMDVFRTNVLSIVPGIQTIGLFFVIIKATLQRWQSHYLLATSYVFYNPA